VLNILKIFLFSSCLLLQACKHNEQDALDNSTKTKPDLSKAAVFNMQLGLGYLRQGDRPRAKKKLLTALEQEPQSPEINAALAYYLEQTKEAEQARTYYLKAIALSGNSGAQLNNYGTFLCRQGDYKLAETYFMKAVNDPQYLHTAGAYENAGLCVLAIPDEEKAVLYFNKALNQDPSKRESLYELCRLEIKKGHSQSALDLLQQHPDLVLNDQGLLMMAKNSAQATGRNDLATEYENTLHQLNQKNELQ